jgi:uncharacterized protein (TIGR02145 family)
MAANTNGLIYYKLDAQSHGYPGDVTKNCGLRGEEIDGNFNFLRGHDIKSISFDEHGTMYLTRYNGEILTAKQAEIPEYDFKYDPENGKLVIITPTGEEITLDGFKVTTTVYHDFSLEGVGTQELPLELSNISKTGRYLPAIKLLDTTREDENGNKLEMLPTENVAKHDRYVTKERISRFGRLFPLSGVEKISERLANINSEWRIPTKADWDEMLNVIDCATPDHDNTDSNVYLGEYAGSALKSTQYWREDKNGNVLSDDQFGFSIYPVGYCGNRGIKYYGSFGESTGFWTSTEEDNHRDMFVKVFDYNTEAVGQRTWGENYYLSLRLVKTFTGNNLNDAEDIDGFTSNCVHIPGTSTIWTRENIAFSQEQYESFVPDEWEKYDNTENVENSSVIRYFVNDWNGNGWDKHEIKEGEGIVLYEGENGRMHEWLLVDGELIDTSILLKEEFKEEIESLYKHLEEETTNRIEVDNQLWAGIEEETNRAQAVESQLWDAVKEEITNRIEVDNQLWAGIETEAKDRLENDIKLWDGIHQETERAQAVEEQLWTSFNEEKVLRQEEDTKLWTGIEEETNRAQTVEADLWTAINNEATLRQEVDAQLWASLAQETADRTDADAKLQKQINENKVTLENNSVVIVPGSTNDDVTTPTTLRVNLDSECEHLKLGENGIYFDGYFGQF